MLRFFWRNIVEVRKTCPKRMQIVIVMWKNVG